MRWTKILIPVMALLVAGSALLIGCGKASEGQAEKSAGTPMKAMPSAIYSAAELYTCPMHAQVVTADSAKKCPLCGMNLKAMDAAAMTGLRAHDLVECPMDPIVMVAREGDQSCPVCGMDLVAVAKGDASGNDHHADGHEGHEHP